MRKRALLFFAPVLMLANDAAARDPLLQYFEGTWGLPGSVVSCEENAVTIGFSEDGSEMRIQYSQPIPGPDNVPGIDFRYRVVGVAGSSVRMALEGETRMTADGDLVIWDLVRLSDEAYCWHRADWEPEVCTAPRLRCKSILDEFQRDLRERTSRALDLMQRHEFEVAARMFDLPVAIPETERPIEYRRLTNSLAIIVREFGAPTKWSEFLQGDESPPEMVNLSIGPSHIVVSQEHDEFFFFFFEVDFRKEGSGFFRAAFDSNGGLVQMTFSLPRQHTERLAEIGEILLRETAHEL